MADEHSRWAKEQTKNHVLDKEVTIRISPRKLVRGGIFVLLFVMVFLLGRYTADGSSNGAATITIEKAAPGTSELKVTETAAPKAAKEPAVSSISGFLTSLFSDSEESSEGDSSSLTGASTTETEESIEEDASATEASSEEDAASATSDTTTEETATEAVDDEPILTTYSKVALAITDVSFDWKTNWGKITKLKYTIKNNEAGTVKVDHMGLLVEGYEDLEKKAPIPPSSRKLKSKTAVSSTANIEGGFSYSKITAGDLNDVVLTINLYDPDGKIVTSFKKGFNLQG